ncbi:MAG: FG-GAP repeat protein [Actinomycetota bacterium]|nr:FG-GAP repeat protein [Actinomycetota bacterium]
MPLPLVGGSAQQRKLTASDAAAGDAFGASVAVSGSIAVLGAPFKYSFAGAAYVFVKSAGVWSQQAELIGSDTASGDWFGFSVAISGPTVVVGAYQRNSDTGAAYVFAETGGIWSQQAELTPPATAAVHAFGYSVAVSGPTVVVGAPDTRSATGAAYVFVASGGTWMQQARLASSDPAVFDQFGFSVGVSASTAVVGAWKKNSSTGAAYVFGESNGVWSQQAELTASDAASNDRFGGSVAVSGSTAVIGAPFKNSQTGAAYVFVESAGAWSEQAELTASDAASGDEFGTSVSISDSTAVVGAPAKRSSTGAGYVYTGLGGAWSQQALLRARDAASGDYFGASVAVSGSTVVAGAPIKDSYTGAAYVFVLPAS